MTTKRRKFTNKFKAMVALAAIREQKTLAELSVVEAGQHLGRIGVC